mmetsp:Transcript_7015/g.12950  ORF Transcript_7015/g.12950 Transcript_7015/m.12950 type:complete len:221 (+) Transcript_7015:122-784(+)
MLEVHELCIIIKSVKFVLLVIFIFDLNILKIFIVFILNLNRFFSHIMVFVLLAFRGCSQRSCCCSGFIRTRVTGFRINLLLLLLHWLPSRIVQPREQATATMCRLSASFCLLESECATCFPLRLCLSFRSIRRVWPVFAFLIRISSVGPVAANRPVRIILLLRLHFHFAFAFAIVIINLIHIRHCDFSRRLMLTSMCSAAAAIGRLPLLLRIFAFRGHHS